MLFQKLKDRRQLPVLGGYASVRDRNRRVLKPASTPRRRKSRKNSIHYTHISRKIEKTMKMIRKSRVRADTHLNAASGSCCLASPPALPGVRSASLERAAMRLFSTSFSSSATIDAESCAVCMSVLLTAISTGTRCTTKARNVSKSCRILQQKMEGRGGHRDKYIQVDACVGS